METGSFKILSASALRAAAAATPASGRATSAPGGAESGSVAPAGGKILPADEARETVTTEDIAKAVQRLVALARDTQRGVRFAVDEGSGRTVITVINASTHEVVRQIPAEEVLAIARAVRRAAHGAGLVDERV